ncbi:hypothetical protein LSAT2_017745 [Lamellibrachia satsuma]|nr:hypothetical protein LSAT2_017745 [Lamellibrachia satsuma]
MHVRSHARTHARTHALTNAASVEQPTPRLWSNHRRVCGTTNAASVEQPTPRLWSNERRVCGTTNAASVEQPTPRLWNNHRRVCGTTNAASVEQPTPRLWNNQRRVCGTTNAASVEQPTPRLWSNQRRLDAVGTALRARQQYRESSSYGRRQFCLQFTKATSWISTMGMMSIPWGYWPHRRSLSAASEQGGRAFAAELSLRFPPPCGTSVSFSTCRPLGRVRQSTIASAGKTLLPRISNTSTGGNHYWWGNMHTFLDVHRCIYAPNGTVKKCTKL